MPLNITNSSSLRFHFPSIASESSPCVHLESHSVCVLSYKQSYKFHFEIKEKWSVGTTWSGFECFHRFCASFFTVGLVNIMAFASWWFSEADTSETSRNRRNQRDAIDKKLSARAARLKLGVVEKPSCRVTMKPSNFGYACGVFYDIVIHRGHANWISGIFCGSILEWFVIWWGIGVTKGVSQEMTATSRNIISKALKMSYTRFILIGKKTFCSITNRFKIFIP